LKLKRDKLQLSKFAFNCNLRPSNLVQDAVYRVHWSVDGGALMRLRWGGVAGSERFTQGLHS